MLWHVLCPPVEGRWSELKEGADALGEEFIPVGREVFGVERTRSCQRIVAVQERVFLFSHLMEGQELHLFEAERAEQLREAARILQARVEAWDHGDARQDGEVLPDRPGEVLKDALVADACARAVLCAVVVLDVEEQEVEARGELLEDGRGGAAGRFNRKVDAFLLQERQERAQEVRLHHALAAGDRDAAAALLVEVEVLQADGGDLLGRAPGACGRERPAGTCFRAGEAAVAARLVDVDDTARVELDRVLRARARAGAAVAAIRLVVEDLHAERLGLRVGAPAAAQRAPLEEDGRADAGTVVDAVFLDVEHVAHGHGRPLLCLPSLYHGRRGL